jgi:hypothetical protein
MGAVKEQRGRAPMQNSTRRDCSLPREAQGLNDARFAEENSFRSRAGLLYRSGDFAHNISADGMAFPGR